MQIDIPVIDNSLVGTRKPYVPTMQQSLQFTKGTYQSVHYFFEQHFKGKPETAYWSIIGFDFLSSWLPFGNSWLHEEWHRAVMSNRGIHSYDEVYDIQFFSETIAVSHVSDAQLISLKRDHPADFVRLSAAGIEAQNELNFSLEKDIFFNNDNIRNSVFLLWVNYLNSWAYLQTCASNKSNVMTSEFNRNETGTIDARDFTGLDCDAWVYDLFRADEPYQDRGKHPSGLGIDRYRSLSDLSAEEASFLRMQRNLHLLNLIDPFLFGKPMFIASSPVTHQLYAWNMTMRHHLTAFGYAVSANFLFQQNKRQSQLSFHNYFNESHYFPGIEAQLFQYPVNLNNQPAKITLRVMAWTQPENLSFYASQHRPGMLASVRIRNAMQTIISPYIELEAKSEGWVAGQVNLGRDLRMQFGVIINTK